MRTNFREKYRLLCKIYHLKYDESECKEYYLKLKQCGETKIDRAFDIASNTIKFFPSVAELIEIINNLPPVWFDQDLKIQKPTPAELAEMETILKEIGG